MAWFDKLIFWKNKEKPAGPFKKIVAIRGEIIPGFLHVDLGEFDENGPTGAPGQHLQLPIPNAFRATANRILCGQETPEDLQVLELHLRKHI